MAPSKSCYTIIALFAASFGGCLASFAPVAQAATETVLYSFQNNGKDALLPDTGVIDVNGTLYGTTDYGGAGACQNGCGAIFSVNEATGAETVLYSFRGAKRSSTYPGSLLAVKGSLFGTTEYGGHRSAGTLFSFDPQSGTLNQRYYFCYLYNCADGVFPNPGLFDLKGTIFGTTEYSSYNEYPYGAVFLFDQKTKTESELYTFCQQENCADGYYPQPGLISDHDMLFGATAFGGTGSSCYPVGQCGTVFSVDPNSGAESVIYSFCSQESCTDGENPNGNLISRGHVLFGTTLYGGTVYYDRGTVYSLHIPSGRETVLYSFEGGQDGEYPSGGLVDVNGVFYGTTSGGGGYGCYDGEGCGTVFSIDPNTGSETVVYSFCSQADCADGAYPSPDLVNVNGTLYGVTKYGGSGSCVTENQPNGCGTVFAITP